MTRKAITIAIQGGPASFHETAAQELYPEQELDLISCASFPELCQTLVTGRAEVAVMAVQNSLAGPLLPNYRLIAEHGQVITAERWLLLDQTLMALPGQSLADIKQVWSHPIALLQCSDFLQNLPGIRTKETADTADTARYIQEAQIIGVSAIASRKAADLYGLNVLHPDVANATENYTRFVVLAPRGAERVLGNKTSCLLPAWSVALHFEKIMELGSSGKVDVTLLQELPGEKAKADWWVLELEASSSDVLLECVATLQNLAPDLVPLGSYTKATSPVPADRMAGCFSTIVHPQIETT